MSEAIDPKPDTSLNHEDIIMDGTPKLPSDAGTASGLDKVRDDIAALRRDVAALASILKNSAIQSTSEAAQHAADQIGERAQQIYGNLADRGERSANTIARQVGERPAISLLIAFAVGFIGSRFLSR